MEKEKFESLTPEEQVKVFCEVSFREKGELLFLADSPQDLAQSLSPEELFLITQELDLEERSEIIRYASLPQLLFLSDIECWKNDRINPKGFTYWLETLLSDEKRLLAWFESIDYETVIAGFSKIMQVVKRDWDYMPDELLGDTPYFTLDEYYFVFVKEDNLESVRRVLELLFENARGRYIAFLEGVMNELEDEIEEEAFRRRGIRLEDRGFTDPETARQIYRPISQTELEKYPKKDLALGTQGSKLFRDAKAPNYPVIWAKDRLFLDDVLLLFRDESPEVRESLHDELIWLSNKVIVSTKIDFASEEVIREGIRRARGFVNIGLEDLSGLDPVKAKKILAERWLETVFRWGMKLLIDLREDAHCLFQAFPPESQKELLPLIDSPFGPMFQGLFRTVPVNLAAPEKDENPEYRDFAKLEDLAAVRLQVEEFRTAVSCFAPQIGLWLDFLRKAPGSVPEEASLFSLLATFFAHFILEKKVEGFTVPRESFQAFMKEAFEKGEGKRVIRPSLKEAFLKAFYPGTDGPPAGRFWQRVFQNLEDELGGLPAASEIDFKFIRGVNLRED